MEKLFSSEIHEYRHCALLILVPKYYDSGEEKKNIVDFYLKNLEWINNWDLVDCSCYKILGNYSFENQSDEILKQLSDSENVWHKRIAVVATLFDIKKGEYDLAKYLVVNNLNYSDHLIHKTNGWILREIGKKNEKILVDFLNVYHAKMPHISLRYAMERLENSLRQSFLVKHK